MAAVLAVAVIPAAVLFVFLITLSQLVGILFLPHFPVDCVVFFPDLSS